MRRGTGSNDEAMAVNVEDSEEKVHTIVIDGSSFTFIDSMGLQTLPSVSISKLPEPISFQLIVAADHTNMLSKLHSCFFLFLGYQGL